MGKWGNSRVGDLGYSYCFVEGLQEVCLTCQGIHLGPQIHLCSHGQYPHPGMVTVEVGPDLLWVHG